MKYRIGLDIGIASVGFAVIETDDNCEPTRIEKLGVRIFDKAEQPKTGASLAEPRRNARSGRRLTRRRHHRVERAKAVLEKAFGKHILEEIAEENNSEKAKSIYELRYLGLDNQLTQVELGRLLLYFVKHRGFLSNRKAESAEKEGGKLLSATSANKKYLEEKGYRTIDEMLFLDSKYSHIEEREDKNDNIVKNKKVYTTRNKEDDYTNTFLRDDLLNELTQILTRQESYGHIEKWFVEKFTSKDGIFYKNRNYDEGPGAPSQYRGGYSIGMCPFEKEEQRSPKSAYTLEYNIALQKLNNLYININGEKKLLTDEEREEIIGQIKEKKEITFASLRKTLGLKDEKCYFNLLNYSNRKSIEETEKAIFVSMKRSYEIRKELQEQNRRDIKVLDKIAQILSMYKADDNRKRELSNVSELCESEIENLLTLNCKEFGGVSIKFCQKIQPYLEQGQKYSDACASAGYNHSIQKNENKTTKLNTKEIHDKINEITSPVVKRSVSQTIKVLNAIIDKYGSPVAINIELARELSKTFEERRKITKLNEESKENNEKLRKEIAEKFGILLPTGQDVLKYLLYE